jgi:hypothetical protein
MNTLRSADGQFSFFRPAMIWRRRLWRNLWPRQLEGITTWVVSAEHLVAIALRTGRSKDHNRILQFVEQDAVNRERLQSILERNGLTAKWKEFERKYLEGTHE